MTLEVLNLDQSFPRLNKYLIKDIYCLKIVNEYWKVTLTTPLYAWLMLHSLINMKVYIQTRGYSLMHWMSGKWPYNHWCYPTKSITPICRSGTMANNRKKGKSRSPKRAPWQVTPTRFCQGHKYKEQANMLWPSNTYAGLIGYSIMTSYCWSSCPGPWPSPAELILCSGTASGSEPDSNA